MVFQKWTGELAHEGFNAFEVSGLRDAYAIIMGCTGKGYSEKTLLLERAAPRLLRFVVAFMEQGDQTNVGRVADLLERRADSSDLDQHGWRWLMRHWAAARALETTGGAAIAYKVAALIADRPDGVDERFDEVAHQCTKLIMKTLQTSDAAVIANEWHRLAQQER